MVELAYVIVYNDFMLTEARLAILESIFAFYFERRKNI